MNFHTKIEKAEELELYIYLETTYKIQPIDSEHLSMDTYDKVTVFIPEKMKIQGRQIMLYGNYIIFGITTYAENVAQIELWEHCNDFKYFEEVYPQNQNYLHFAYDILQNACKCSPDTDEKSYVQSVITKIEEVYPEVKEEQQ